ncbi:enoyl-CoA hydratase/isomerase family protein [Streptomyces sp. ISL-12]|uniref:enoyl-CoA hydratase/isomerase family protein n=1 Tax=Streptomyces sp. ISL-12 TaxID=2819177 RepID=UPI001BEC07AA|nr:enoyl-CoA hydratase-related protein [Streptomyces sp. ISL-12]MBT2413696.1 enoyl-CoA hydratase/isomerase family protein [Streptomyces sp. ISL-12]
MEVADGVGVLRLDRGPVNALDRAAQRDLHRAAAEAATRRDVRAVVLHGGPRIFSAGADIKEMAAMTHAEMAEHSAALQAAFTAVAEIPKPVVAAVNGAALGGGCELALAADFRVCAEDTRIGLPEILLGVIPGAGGTQRLTRLVGIARAKDLIYSGRALDAAAARDAGLVDEVVAADQVFPAALRRARSYVEGPAVALAAAKRAVDTGATGSLHEGLAVEREAFAALFATRDRLTGMRTFAAEGPGRARFEGR